MKTFVKYLLSSILLLGLIPQVLFSQHSDEELADSLVFSMSFRNDTGFYATELVSGQTTGETRFGARFSAGGLYLDGTDDELKYPKSDITLLDGQEISISAWFKADGTAKTNSILSKFFAYELKVIDGFLQLNLVVDGFQYFKAKTTEAYINAGQLHHVAAIRNNTEILFYVDGVLIPTEYLDPQSDATLYPANNDIFVGSGNAKECFDGIIYDIEIYKLALDEQDVAAFVSSHEIPNLPPIADAGPTVVCYPDVEYIELTGSSTDFYDAEASESWQQVYGHNLTVTDDTIRSIQPGYYQFEYTVTDNAGQTDISTKHIYCYDYSTALVFVAPNGNNDTGKGTITQLFQTINRALQGFNGNHDLIVHLLPGEYLITEQIVLPERVSLIGAGKLHTLFIPDENLLTSSQQLGNSLILIENSTVPSKTGHFKIDGQQKQLGIGLGVKNAQNLELEHIEIVNTWFSGLGVVDISHSEIHDIKLVNTSWGSTDYSAGSLILGDAEHVNIYNIDISEGLVDKPELWGYGIKGFQIEGSTFLKHVNIFDSKIETRNEGFWNDGEAPNISIEFHSVAFDSCQIYNVEVNSTISLVPNSITEGSKNIRLHHSKIHSPKGVPIESYMVNCEIDHNYILGEYSTIKGFNNNLYSDYLVHHNVFSDQYPKVGASQAMSYGALENVQFYNNTVYYTQFNDLTALELFSGASSGFDVANNIFYAAEPGTSKVIGLKNGATLTDVQLRNNVLYNFTQGTPTDTEENTFTDDPGLELLESPAYSIPVPGVGSYVVDAGVDVGLPYEGDAPDIGAGEAKVGYGMAPTIEVVSPLNNQVFNLDENISISVNAQDTDGTIDSLIVMVNDQVLNSTGLSAITTNFTPKNPGNWVVKVRVIDNSGLMATQQLQINVNVSLEAINLVHNGPIDLMVGNDTLMEAIFTPLNATNQILVWESDQPEIAMVNPTGLVTGLSMGSAVITATSADGGHIASILINVSDDTDISQIGIGEISIYPNPVKDIIHFEGSFDIIDVVIIYMSGKTELLPIKENQTNVEHLQKGVYFLQVETTQGITMHKVVKY